MGTCREQRSRQREQYMQRPRGAKTSGLVKWTDGRMEGRMDGRRPLSLLHLDAKLPRWPEPIVPTSLTEVARTWHWALTTRSSQEVTLAPGSPSWTA